MSVGRPTARPAGPPPPPPAAAAPPAAGPPGVRLPGWREHLDHLAAGRFLRVVNYHATPVSRAGALRAELAALTRDHVGVTVADLDAFFAAGRWPDDRPRLVPVFYEGYADHARVAAPVCDELGLTAWFAPCTGFVECPPGEQELFARSHWIAVPAEELDGRRLALSWDELADLAARHVLVAHTAAHDGVADVVTDDDLEREVAVPARRLADRTGADVAVFAWMGGTPFGTSPRHDAAVVAAGHRYVLSNTMVQRVAGPPVDGRPAPGGRPPAGG